MNTRLLLRAHMKQITESEIERVINDLELKEEPLKYIFEKMDKSEPHLFEYISTVDDDEFNGYERSILMAAGATGWYLIEQIKGCNEDINSFLIEDHLDRNFDLFDNYFAEDNKSCEIKKLFSTYNEQPFLIDFLMDFMFKQSPHQKESLRDDRIFLLSIHLNTVIDCLVFNEDTPIKH